jgi:hypothetical protein
MIEEKEPVFIEESDSVAIYIDGVRWYTYKQMSALLDISVSAIYKRVRAGKIERKKIEGLSVYR